ncbi:hypothetical protein [Burkholderia sp. Tr-20390]|uniref:hypothetical protein n=1 Tax=Burkholderia sp. Tr-20390 TaxID=2703904 RepID=UPI00197D9547|nr:hypothetical protein [Burkholderia sp. Tr-20390]MBN3729487.1 hypothetical protein [Burkholderia sp. Tr-20390]
MRKKISVGLFHLFALALSIFALGVAVTLSFVLREVLVVPLLSAIATVLLAIGAIVSSAKESTAGEISGK